MATNPDPTPPAAPSPTVPLWAAPVFLLGVAALVTVCLCRPLLCPRGGCRDQRDLLAARQAVLQPDGDLDQAMSLARRVQEQGHFPADRAGEPALLLAAAHVRLAEKGAAASWTQAKEFLAQAEKDGIAAEDQPLLTYLLARVDFNTGGPLDSVISRLEGCIEQVEPRAEAYDLLGRAYLRLPNPDLNKALAANHKLREVPDLSPSELAQAQLAGGELLLKLNKPEEARKSLSKIGKQAPADIQVRAHVLTARSWQNQRRWEEAVTGYKAALASGVEVPQPSQLHYNLGLCYRQLGQIPEATHAWRECVRLARGEEAQAANIVLAELYLLAPELDKVFDSLAASVARLEEGQPWNNPLVEAARVREVFEQSLRAFRQAGNSELALKTLEPYARLAEPRRLLELRAHLCGEVAKARRDKVPAGTKWDPLADKETAALFRQAAKAHSDVAALPGLKPDEIAEHVWSAVKDHLAVGENEQAKAGLERLVKMTLPPARMGEALFLLGEEFRLGRDDRKAGDAYRECMKYDSRFAYLARYQLAMAALRGSEVDAAKEMLAFNLSQMQWESDADALAQSLFAYCDLLYARGAYAEVVRKLEQALDRYRDKFKDVAELTLARYQLADSYRKIASQENQQFLLKEKQSPETRAHFQKQHRLWLLKAAEEFASLDSFLYSPEGRTYLSVEQRNSVPFTTAKCWFNLGQYDKALVVYDRLIERYKGKPDEVVALGGAVSCHAALVQVDHVRQRLTQIDQALPKLPAEMQVTWKAWLDEAVKGLKDY